MFTFGLHDGYVPLCAAGLGSHCCATDLKVDKEKNYFLVSSLTDQSPTLIAQWAHPHRGAKPEDGGDGVQSNFFDVTPDNDPYAITGSAAGPTGAVLGGIFPCFPGLGRERYQLVYARHKIHDPESFWEGMSKNKYFNTSAQVKKGVWASTDELAIQYFDRTGSCLYHKPILQEFMKTAHMLKCAMLPCGLMVVLTWNPDPFWVNKTKRSLPQKDQWRMECWGLEAVPELYNQDLRLWILDSNDGSLIWPTEKLPMNRLPGHIGVPCSDELRVAADGRSVSWAGIDKNKFLSIYTIML